MDGQRFDKLARAFANGSSRRRLLKGLVTGAVSGAFAQFPMQSARAQCTWSGTFEAPFNGDISMTLNEAGGQVTGNYTFTQDNAVRNGSISGVVRTDFPGYTVLDGYWREPEEGGRVWFVMPLDACAQFTGSYTGTDTAEEWISGWDGLRTGGTGGAEDDEVTFFSNPGETRVAAFTIDGQAVTLFGLKNDEGFVQYINQAQVDAADGDPQKQVFLEFAADGTPTQATLGSGETMAFEMVSDTRIIITYQSADGTQEVQVPFDLSEDASDGAAAHSEEVSVEQLLAYTSQPALGTTLREHHAALRIQPPPPPKPPARGTIQVRCGSGALVKAYVSGFYARPDTPADLVRLSFWSVAGAGPGVYEYTLPLVGTAPLDEQALSKWIGYVRGAFGLICLGKFVSGFASPALATAICAKLGLATAGAGVVPCGLFWAAFSIVCLGNTSINAAKTARWLADGYDRLDVIAEAWHPKLGRNEIRFKAYAGYEIPVGEIRLAGVGGIESITTDPLDPDPQQGYTVTVRPGGCVPSGTVLTLQVVGTDNYAPSPTTVTLSDTVTEGTLYVPGAEQGIQDTVTATLSGSATGTKTKVIVF